MEEKRRRNISIPIGVDGRLRKDKHASQTIVDALRLYWAGKDGTKELAKLMQQNTDAVNGLDEDITKMMNLVKELHSLARGGY